MAAPFNGDKFIHRLGKDFLAPQIVRAFSEHILEISHNKKNVFSLVKQNV